MEGILEHNGEWYACGLQDQIVEIGTNSAAMEEIISSGNNQLILDISRLSFMDSSSLGAMVSVLKQIGGTGKMVIFGASGAVLELFKLTRMDRIFTLTNDLETAKQYF